jgi:Raf kinase inhibitor-like YbhB/YbcL family protein
MHRALAAGLAVGLVGCGGDSPDKPPAPSDLPVIAVASPQVTPGGTLAPAATCAGAGRSPALRIAHVPRGTSELVVLLVDPDAPGRVYTHWAVSGVRPETKRIAAGQVPHGALVARNDAGKVGYAPPCPPAGDDPHGYRLFVYALGAPSQIPAGASPQIVDRRIRATKVLGVGILRARYGRG